MLTRRNTRGQKRKEVEALSSRPDIPSSVDSSCTSKKLDEVDGPAPVLTDKKTSQPTSQKRSKKTAASNQQTGTKKDGKGQKDNEQGNVVRVLQKKSQEDGIRQETPAEGNIREKRRTSSRQTSSRQKQKIKNARESVIEDETNSQHNGSLPAGHNSESAMERDEKEQVHPKDVKPTIRSDSERSNPTSQIRDDKSAIDIPNRQTNSLTTEDSSSSDSDFEEVSSQYRTPESLLKSSMLSDSGTRRKLEDRFLDYTLSSSQDMSVSVSGSDVTDFSSSLLSVQTDSDVNVLKRNPASEVKGSLDGLPSEKAAKKTPAAAEKIPPVTDIEKKTASAKSKTRSKQATKPKNQQRNVADPNKQGKKSKNTGDRDGETGRGRGTDEDNIMALLMKMEGQPPKPDNKAASAVKPSTSGQTWGRKVSSKKVSRSSVAEDGSSEESDWEEVEDYKHSPVKSQIPDAPVEITIDDPTMLRKKRKKKEFDWRAYVQRKIKRLAREVQIDMHKVHLLCLVSHGIQQNSVCSDVTVCATAFSMVPENQLKKDVAFHDDQTLVFFLKWFRSTFCLSTNAGKSVHSLVTADQLVKVIQDTTAGESRLLVMVLAAMLRAMGFNVRLVISLQPLPLKPSSAALDKVASKRKIDGSSGTSSTSSKKAKQASGKQKSTKAGNDKRKSAKSATAKPKPVEEKNVKEKGLQQSKSDQKTAPSTNQKSQQPKSSDTSAVRKRKQVTKSKKLADTDSSSSDEDDEDDDGPSVAKRRASGRTRKTVKPSSSAIKEDVMSDDDGDVLSSHASDGSNFSEEEEAVRKKIKASRQGKGKKPSGQNAESVDMDEQSEEEFDRSFQSKSLLVKEEKRRKKANRKVLSAESSEEEATESKGRDYWLEVYLPRQNKWFCVDCIRCTVGKPYDTSAAASQPLLYVLGFANDGSVKDITAKYAPQWLSHTRKRRVDSDWWRGSLEPFASTNTILDDQENRDIKDHLVQRPLPTNIGDFKNHPLYALRRHLLKYEAIYPENSIPVGYIRHEPVYARECVHTLHSRDNWLKEARLVRLGETPYKLVKSRKRWNRARLDNPDELDLELFGRWQTEDYIPPPAVNGKVPKNEYGNVELFQPSMLPGGTVHIRVPALNRVAKKLGIDIAAAMTGWDHHCGYSHPVLDGWVVCEEHQDILLAAWDEDQEMQRQRDEERREKRVLNNWTTLVRGLLIKEKLKKTFNLEEKTAKPEVKKKVKAKKGEKATDVQDAWPAKQQQKQTEQKEKVVAAPSHYTVETM